MAKYLVIGPLPIDDVPTGDTVELDDETGARLCASGHVAPATPSATATRSPKSNNIEKE